MQTMLDKINAQMSIGARLGLVSGLFIASSAVVTTIFVMQAQSQIEFSAKESEGGAYLMQVWDALESGSRVDADQAGAVFDSAAAVSAFNSAATEDDKIDTGLALITAVADGSNLTLDPELDSFYAMDAATIRIPTLWAAAQEFEQAVLSTAEATQRDMMINVEASNLEAAGAAAVHSMEAAMEDNASGETRAALTGPTSAITEAVSNLLAAGRAAAPGQRIDADSQSFKSAIGASWRATAEELIQLCDARVSRLSSDLMMQLGIIGLLLAIASASAWVVASGLGTRFEGLTESMDRLNAGDLEVEVPHASDSCETGKIAQTLVALKKGMAERVVVEQERVAKATEQARVVETLASGLKGLAEGDLTGRIDGQFPREYEQLRSDFNAAIDKLQSAMKAVIANAGGIRSGAGEISQAADDLSRRTEQQAASLEQTAAALDETS